MSFDSEYLELRKKRKQREQQRLKEITEKQNINTQIDTKLDFFQKGVFDDGYQVWDISKAILGTVGDAGLSFVRGMSNLGEGLLDTVGYAAAGIADSLGKKGWADDIRRHTQDSYTDDMFYIPNSTVEDKTVLGRTSRAILEGVGQVAGIAATAGMGGTAGLGTKGVTALTSAVSGLSGFGSGTSEAYQSGATDEEAVTYGLISATSDVITEMLFGGLGKGLNAVGLSKGLSSADDMLAKKISTMFSSQIAKNISEFGVKAGAEGVEEVLAGVMQAVGKKMTYMSEEELTQILKDEKLLEQFVVGMASSGFMQAGDLYTSNKTKTDFITGLSQNEQAVFDKIYNDRVNEAKKGGKKLSGKDKENIYNSVMNDIEKGYIGISDIESVLGGETYKQYQSAVEEDNRMKELQSEYDTLYKMKNGEKSDEQIDRQKALKEQLEEYKNTSKLSDIQKQLSNEVSELVKTSKLAESYNEKSRRSQTFETDLTQYDEKHQGTYKRAMESGVLNNTNRTHEFVDLLAKLEADKGVLFDFTNNEKIKETGFAIEGKQVNGYVQGNNIAINIDSTNALNKVVGHEITHVLEGTELYNELANAVKEFATAKGEYDSKLQSIAEVYEGMENVNLENELTADLIGEYLFTDSDFINRLSAEKPTLFKKIFDEIKYLCKVATAGSKEARQLEKVKKTFEEAYRQKNNTATDDGVKYSVAGVKSKTHNFSAFEQAIRLEDVGKATSEEIRQQTGWYRGYDGEWRYEINDKDMKIKDVDITSGETKLGDVLEHQELFDAYPELKDVTISAFPSMLKPYTNGYYNKIDNEISLADYFLVNTAVEKELAEIKNNPEYKSYIENLKNSTETHNTKRLELAKEFKEIQKTSEYEAYIDDYFNSGSSENGQKVIEEWKNSDIGKRYEEIKAELSRMDKTNPKTEIENQFRESEIGKRYYELINNIDTSEITNNAETRKTLIHEIQHAIQHIERFANGSSVEYWAKAPVESKPGTLAYAESVRKKLGEKILSSASPEFVQAFREYNRGDIEYSDIENGNFTEEELDMLWDYDEADREVAYLLEHKGRTDEDLYYSTAGEIEARDTSKRLDYSDEQRKNTRPDIDRTDVVFAENSGVGWMSAKDARYDSETASISEQIKNSQSTLNNMNIVGEAVVPENLKDKYEAAQWAISQLKAFGYQVDRQNFGKIYFDEKDIRKGAEYADTNAEKGAFVLIPKVLKRGIQIGHHGNHKLRQKETVTFAAPVMLNGTRGNMAVVVNVKGNRYLVHRIILPDGTTFKFSEKNKEVKQESYQGVTENSSLADTTSFTSNNSVPQDNATVNNNSMQDKSNYSLSNANDDIAPVGNNNVYGEDIKLQSASAEDIAPTAEDIKNQDTIVIDDAPIKDASLEDVTEENNVEDTIDAEAVTRLSSKVISTLGIGKSKANRNAVRELVKTLGDNYSISSKEDLYNAVAEKFGTQYVEELNEEIAGARSYLKEVKINVPNSVKSEFGSNKDYRSFVKSNFGKLWLSKEGSGIDQIYAELNEMYPHLFPSDISNQADQLKQISDVVNKPKSDFIPFELDEDILQEATDLIYDSVTEYREAVNKVNQVNADIEAADISDRVKGQIKEELLTAYEKIEAEFNIDKKNLINKLNERKSFLETDTADKNTFLQYHAGELYGELKNLKKGIKASEDLAYFLDLGFNWNELKSTLLKVSKWPDTVLNAESDIEKTVRDFLDQKYDDSIQELNDFDWTMEDEISSLESKAEEKRNNARLAVNGKLVREIMDAEQVAMMGDTSLWKDKSKGFMYKTETEHRNFRDIVRDKNGKRNYKVADVLYDYFMGTYNHNEAELKREANKIKKEYADLKLNKYEDVFVQMKGEFLHNPDSELTQHDIDTFKKLYGDKVDETKVDKTIDMARETYDSLIERMNEVLVAHGMKSIEYRKGYFPHFSEVEKGKLAQLAEKFLNWKTQNNDIPTDIAGMTESFKPNRSWQSFNKQRINDETDYSFMKGFDSYLQGSLDWIYHIDDIMKRRVFENRIRYDHSDEGIKQQIQEIYKNNEFDTNAKQEQIDLVFREAENPLNNFIIDFRTRTNTLAGKKSSMDRGMEEFTNRKFYSTMTNISNRVTANMVVGSVSSALTNFIPITQSWGEVSLKSSLRAMKDTIKSTFKDDGTINKSDFLTNRFKDVENLYQTGWDKFIDKAGILMEAVDNFTSQTVWRSKYLENMSKGMSEAEAIKNADEFAEGLIAGRSRGNMPTIFDSKNPLIKMATAFQLEVNNQYRYMFKDMPQNMKNESVAKLVKGYATMFIGAYAYNAAYSALTGRDAAFDPLGIFEELLRDLGWLGDDEEEEPADIIMNLTDNLLEEVPFVGGLLGGGRVPISSALPYDDGILGAFEGTVTDLTEGDLENLTKEWLSSAGAYLLLPAGGGQLKKSVQGLSMFDDDLPIAGSYTDSGKLRFTVDETMDEMVKAGLFGQYASKNARQYFDEERAPLSDKQTQELIDLDVPIADYWKYRDGLKDLGEDAKLKEKVAYIADLEGLSTEQKNIMANNLTDRKDPIDLTDYDKYGDLDELDYAVKYPGKYAVSKAVGGYSKYIEYSEHLNNITSEKNAKGETVSGSRKIKVARYINNLDIDYGEKIILYKSQYPGDDTYNSQIIDYLNSRDDISRKEMETILKELGFEVYADGTVRW